MGLIFICLVYWFWAAALIKHWKHEKKGHILLAGSAMRQQMPSSGRCTFLILSHGLFACLSEILLLWSKSELSSNSPIGWFIGSLGWRTLLSSNSLFCSLNKILHGTPDIFPSKALPFPLFPQHFAPDSRTSFLSDAEWQQLQSLSLAFRLHRCESSASACSWNPSFGSFRASSSDKWGGSVHLINEGEVEIENIIRC